MKHGHHIPADKRPAMAVRAFEIAQATESRAEALDGKTIEPPPQDWGIDIHKLEHCIVMAQAVRAEIDKASAN